MGYRDRDDSIRDRDKKSFSDLDKGRREKKYRGEEPSGNQKRVEHSQAYSNYKRQLNQAFDGGGLPEALKAKLGDTEVGKKAKEKKAALKALTTANAPTDILAAFAAYQENFGFPEETGGLAKLLELEEQPEIVVEALHTIARLADEGSLQKTGSLKMRVKTVKMTIDDDDVFSAAKALLKKL